MESAGPEVDSDEVAAPVDVTAAVVQRPVQEVAVCLACALCDHILKDPITAPECMHSFCRECIEAELVGTIGGNVCPACANEGEQTLLGANPFAYHRLQPDFVLEALVRKIFPDQVKDDYNKLRPEADVRQKRRPRQRGPAQQMAPADVVPLFLCQKEASKEVARLNRLEMPYLRVPKALPVAMLAKYVAERLSAPADMKIMLFRGEELLTGSQTVQEAAEAGTAAQSLLELHYAVQAC